MLYLVQHGEAAARSEDPARPLTDKGRDDAERVGRAAAQIGVSVNSICHSGKLRARQTAEIFAQQLGLGLDPRAVGGLAPNDYPALARKMIASVGVPTMLVGHLPHLSWLASLLILGESEPEVVRFQNAGIVCLERLDDARWAVRWALTPDVVRRIEFPASASTLASTTSISQ